MCVCVCVCVCVCARALVHVRVFMSMCVSVSYPVGSVDFLRRKIGLAHDNSADSENVAGAHEPNVHVYFIFSLENGQGNQSFSFLSMTKIQLKRVMLSRRTIDAPSTGRFCEASSDTGKNLVQHGLVGKKKDKLHG